MYFLLSKYDPHLKLLQWCDRWGACCFVCRLTHLGIRLAPCFSLSPLSSSSKVLLPLHLRLWNSIECILVHLSVLVMYLQYVRTRCLDLHLLCSCMLITGSLPIFFVHPTTRSSKCFPSRRKEAFHLDRTLLQFHSWYTIGYI